MNPKEIQAAARQLADAIGIKAQVFVSVDGRGTPLRLAAYAYGICGDVTFYVQGDDWPELFDNARSRWDEMQSRFQTEIVEKIALEIIRITSKFGECTDAALRGDKFSDADISQYGAMACERANDMASNGPFSITPAAKANAA